MHRVLRLSINALAGRRNRTILLAGAVMLSTALVAAVSCALASLSAGMTSRVNTALGAADIRIREIGENRFDNSVAASVGSRTDILAIAPRLKGPVSLRNPLTGASDTLVGVGIDPEVEYELADVSLSAGRRVESPDEVVLAQDTAMLLSAEVGDQLEVVRWGAPLTLKVIGITRREQLELATRPECFLLLSTLEDITGYRGKLSELLIKLADTADATAIAEDISKNLPIRIIAESTAKITAGLDAAVRANQFGFVLASLLAYISAAFIVLTGLTTNMLERRRELAILRCIGADRWSLAGAQLCVGALIGAVGAAAGVPFGIFLAWILTVVFPERLRAGLHVDPAGMTWAAAGAVIAGLLGAVWPALAAARTTPLHSLSVRAFKPRRKHVAIAGVLGLLGLLVQASIVGTVSDGQRLFWLYASLGLPAMFVGYFLIGVPLSIVVARVMGPLIAAMLRLPRAILIETVVATPFRHGFTAGALMVGLAMMTGIWTNGAAILRDWVGAIDFPEAFVHGWLGLTPDVQQRIDDLPFVTDTCAITLQRIEDQTFGVRAFHSNVGTTFVAFEPEPFFRLARLNWIEGDRDVALAKLERGNAALIAREFMVAGGYHVGDTYKTLYRGQPLEFEIVGVVSSPGLDIVNKYFDIGKEYANQAVHSIFGTRADLQKLFNVDDIHLIQIGLDDAVSDEEAIAGIRAQLEGIPAVVGSGKMILDGILEIGRGSLRIASIVAVAAMLIGSLGVGNILIAGIEGRRFEFGVLRAVGASRSFVARLLVAEVCVLALTACVLGTAIGFQGCWAGIRLNRLLVGIDLKFQPELGPIALGWVILLALSIGVVLPAIVRVSRIQTRELIASTRG